MNAADLKHRITVRRLQQGIQDPETGDLRQGWADMMTVWAQIVPVSVREFLQASAVQNEISARIVVRYSTDTAKITPDCILVHGSDTYEIKGIMADPDGGRTYLTLVCAKKEG